MGTRPVDEKLCAFGVIIWYLQTFNPYVVPNLHTRVSHINHDMIIMIMNF